MTRSHPPTLLTLVKRALTREARLARGAHILVAVSGGPDSMALLHVLALLRRSCGLVLSAHGVDHGLRQAAAQELDEFERFAESLGVPSSRSQLRVTPGGNLQARAREARYAALRRQAKRDGADLIATAHHAEDRAETVLLRLLRGAGTVGLAVLPMRAGDLLRPLIHARRQEVRNHLSRHAIPFSQDPSNLDRRFLRVRVREELLPLMEELSPGIVAHLNSLADQVASQAPPTVLDGDGEQVVMNRAQALQLAGIIASGRQGARVALSRAREIELDESGRPQVVPSRLGSRRSQG